MTKGEAIELMLRWLDEATSNGQPAPTDQIADLKDRAAHLLDGVLKYLAGHFKIPAIHSVVRSPEKNLIGNGGTPFPMTTINPPFAYFKTAEGAKSFYIEVCGNVALAVKSGSTTLFEAAKDCKSFEPIKANIPDASGVIRIEVQSAFPALVRNAAMYENAYATDDDVPDYIPYVPYEMPEDYRDFDKLVQTSDGHHYRQYNDFRKEGLKTFLLPHEARGQFDFHYFRNPADVPSTAPDDTELEVASHAAQLVPLKLAVDCCMGVDDTMTIGYYLNNRFNEMIVNLLTDNAGEMLSIGTVYSML